MDRIWILLYQNSTKKLSLPVSTIISIHPLQNWGSLPNIKFLPLLAVQPFRPALWHQSLHKLVCTGMLLADIIFTYASINFDCNLKYAAVGLVKALYVSVRLGKGFYYGYCLLKPNREVEVNLLARVLVYISFTDGPSLRMFTIESEFAHSI